MNDDQSSSFFSHPAHYLVITSIIVAISTIIITMRGRLLNHGYTVIDSIFLEGMKCSLAKNEMMSQGDYIIVDKPTLFDIFPYRNDNSNSNSNNNNKSNNYF